MTAGPRLDASVQVHDAALAAVLDQGEAGNVERGVEEKIAGCKLAVQNLDVVVRGQRLDAKRDAVLFSNLASPLFGGDDGDLLLGHVDVPQNQRQSALSDGAEAHDQDSALEGKVFLVIRHFPSKRQKQRLKTQAALPGQIDKPGSACTGEILAVLRPSSSSSSSVLGAGCAGGGAVRSFTAGVNLAPGHARLLPANL